MEVKASPKVHAIAKEMVLDECGVCGGEAFQKAIAIVTET